MTTIYHPPPYVSDPLLKEPENVDCPFVRPKPKSNTTILGRIGYYSIAVLVIGTLVILLAFAYVSFLWWSESSNSTWHQIVLNSWVAPSVTLASLAIRTSISFQAIVSTAMVAALALQWHQVDIADSAAVSLFRFSNSGPSSLLRRLFGNGKRLLPSAGILALCLTLVTLASHATSTALVKDLGIAVVPGNIDPMDLAFGVNLTKLRFQTASDGDMRPPALWKRRPTQYASFAERTVAGPVSGTKTHDTGVQIRAFLPLPSGEDRSRVHSYNGTLAGITMRTFCVRPIVDVTNTTQQTFILGKENPDGTGVLKQQVTGTVTADPDEEWTDVFDTSAGTEFECNVQQYGLTVCTLASSPAVYLNLTKVDMGPLAPFLRGLVGNPTAYDSSKPAITVDSYLVWQGVSGVEEHAEWTNVSIDRDDGSPSHKLSLCTTVLRDQYMDVSASRSSNATEPSMGWTKSPGNNFSETIDTTPIREQLGVVGTSSDPQKRGILSLDSWTDPTSLPEYFSSLPKMGMLRMANMDYKFQWSLYSQGVATNWTDAWDWTDSGFDYYIYKIVNDILNNTDHPSLMLQAFTTMQYSEAYYNDIVAFDLQDPDATIQYFVSAVVPIRRRGYWAVAVIIVCHLVLVLGIVGLYIAWGGPGNILGQAWSSVTQLRSQEMGHIFQNGDILMDEDVKKLLKKQGVRKRRVGLVHDDVQGFVIGSLRE